jgi:hypothetical protein
MAKTNRIEQLRSRSEKIYSNGKLLDYKLYGDRGKRRYLPPQQYENQILNPVQTFLYKRALKGLDAYNKKELRELDPVEKHKVIRLYSRTQKELNMWKHKLTIEASNELLELFPNSPLANAIIKDDYLDVQTENSFSFRDLGIKREDIIAQLHKVGILPNNFYEINAK